jgi:hypothetical protein
MNTHHPGDPGISGDHEPSAAEFMKSNHFCSGGTVTKVECYSVTMDAPAESSGEIITCNAERGLVCDDSDNFPIPCGDYKIRYYCACGMYNQSNINKDAAKCSLGFGFSAIVIILNLLNVTK